MPKWIPWCWVAVLAAVMAGCDGGSNDPDTYSLEGKWVFDAKSDDNFIAFSSTQLTITTNETGYVVAWMSDSPNGTAVLDTNTLTVVMSINSPPTTLELTGKMADADLMQGHGTIGGYGGLRVATWSARR